MEKKQKKRSNRKMKISQRVCESLVHLFHFLKVILHTGNSTVFQKATDLNDSNQMYLWDLF